MSTKVKNSNATVVLVHVTAVALCLLAPFIVFLTANNYSIVAAEVFPFYLAALGVGAVFAVLMKLRLVVIANVVLWGCLVISVAFLYQLRHLFPVFAVALACAAILWLLKENGVTVLLIAAAVHIGSTIALQYLVRPVSEPVFSSNQEIASNSAAELPLVLHLVLDEFVGLHGVPSEVPGSQELVSKLEEYYLGQGFSMFSHAYSQYTDTTNSLPNLVNFSSSSGTASYVSGGGEEFSVTDNRYFKHLLDLGYKLHVYQSNYLNFCVSPGVPVSSCSSYKNNSIEAIATLNISVTQKSLFIRNSFLDSSAFLSSVRYFYSLVAERVGIDLPPWPTGNSRTGPLAVLPTLARLKAALRELRPGEFHFAHLMLPHYPYNLQADCTVKPNIKSWLNIVPFGLAGNQVERNSVASRSERYVQYIAQVECTHSIIKELIGIIQDNGHWEKSIIIIHGDHGSRIVRRGLRAQNVNALTEDDYRDAYSTFFAVKNGAAFGELSTAPLPLQTLLATLWQLPALQQDMRHVYLNAGDQPELQATPLLGFGLIDGDFN